jgi:hypothetical protein
MSLKAVHVVFVVAAVLLCLSVGALSLGVWRREGGAGWLISSGLWWAAGGGLTVYGRRVVRKLRSISYL